MCAEKYSSFRESLKYLHQGTWIKIQKKTKKTKKNKNDNIHKNEIQKIRCLDEY